MERKCHSKAGIVHSEPRIVHFADAVGQPEERVTAAAAGAVAAGPGGKSSARSRCFHRGHRVFTRLRRGPLTA